MAPFLVDRLDNKIEQSPIQEFYSKSKIFITGGTGFLGKILIEKLLRSCPDLSCIYILIRDKKGVSMHERIDEILDNVVFEKLREENVKYRHKVIGIKGDCELPNLGMAIEDIETIQNEVRFSIKFNLKITLFCVFKRNIIVMKFYVKCGKAISSYIAG